MHKTTDTIDSYLVAVVRAFEGLTVEQQRAAIAGHPSPPPTRRSRRQTGPLTVAVLVDGQVDVRPVAYIPDEHMPGRTSMTIRHGVICIRSGLSLRFKWALARFAAERIIAPEIYEA